METLTVNYKGIEIHINEVNTEFVDVSIEEGNKLFAFPYDISYRDDYQEIGAENMFYSHPELLETIGEWAVNERASMVGEIMAGLSRAAFLNKTDLTINYTVYAKIGHLDITVFDNNKMVKRWNCVYLGVNAFKVDHIGSIESKLVEFLNNY